MNPPLLLRRTLVAGAAAAALAPGSMAVAAPVGREQSQMIHIFVLRLIRDVTPAQKAEAVARIKALQGVIPGLLEASVGLNQSVRGQGYELGGAIKFADAGSLAAYNDHPAHQELLGWLEPFIEHAIEVDFPAG